MSFSIRNPFSDNNNNRKLVSKNQGKEIASYLSILELFKDEVVTDIAELRPGDHIIRPGVKDRESEKWQRIAEKLNLTLFYHHGIYMGKDANGTDQVSDFGEYATYPLIKNLKAFQSTSKLLYRRNYLGNDINPLDTVARAKWICEDSENRWKEWDVVENNCVHYATRLKLGDKCSHKDIQKLKSKIRLKEGHTIVGEKILSKMATDSNVFVSGFGTGAAIGLRGVKLFRKIPYFKWVAYGTGTAFSAAFILKNWSDGWEGGMINTSSVLTQDIDDYCHYKFWRDLFE